MSEKKETIEEHIENEEVASIKGEKVNDNSEELNPDNIPHHQKIEEELAEMKDKFLRLYSEFDNYRKRTQKERSDLFKSAGADVITSLLPVLDDFERALKYVNSSEKQDGSNAGIELIYNKLKSVLESKGLKRMNSVGEVFSDELHEAIANVPAPDPALKGRVIDESECGYYLNEKVIRHAKVIVGS